MHELHADAAGINLPRGVGSTATDVKLGVRKGLEVPQRVEVCLKVSPAAERIDHALLLLAVNIHHYGGQVRMAPLPQLPISGPAVA